MTRPRSRTWMVVAALFLPGLLLAGCAMLQSTAFEPLEGKGCASSAGAYFVPKTQLLLTVVSKTDEDHTTWYDIDVRAHRVPDPRFGFCLDYLASPTSDDIVDIKKYKRAPFLGVVSTDAIDESRYILETLIQSVFVLISGKPDFKRDRARDFKVGDTKVAFQADFDPFDAGRTAEINRALRDYGYCLVLPSFSFNAGTVSPEAYCQQPVQALARAGVPDLDYRHENNRELLDEGHVGQGGIFYRVRIPYPVHIYLKDPRLGRWRLGVIRQVDMENISPLIGVAVDRTFFAQRKTTLLFDEGQLTNVCVHKGSELVNAAAIPLQVVQSIVALPSEVFQVRIDQTNNQKELIKVEEELIRLQLQHYKFLQDPQNNQPPSKPGRPPTVAGLPSAQDADPGFETLLKPVRPGGNECGVEAADKTKLPLALGYEPILNPDPILTPKP